MYLYLLPSTIHSIKEKLFALGYTEDEFPVAPYWGCPAARTWGSIVEQPKELTDRSMSSHGMQIPQLT